MTKICCQTVFVFPFSKIEYLAMNTRTIGVKGAERQLGSDRDIILLTFSTIN